MRLAKNVKFREEKFGGVLFETRSEKVYTLTPTAAAVVQEIAAGRASAEIGPLLAGRFDAPDGTIEREVAQFLDRIARKGAGGRLSVTTAASETLAAPLYVAWQITNECNLACLHCIEESGPGKAFPDELDRDQLMRVIDDLMAHEVPYLSFSGGEPMLHPHFFEMVERVTSRGSQLKIETNGHYLTPENCERLAKLEVKAVQVSLDGATSATFGRMRVRGEFDRTVDGIRNLRAAGVPVEINFSPASFNIHEAARIVDLAYELGAASFYSGRTMFTGNAVKAWRHLAVSEDDYATYFETLALKRAEYRGRMRVDYHEAGLLEELRYRLEHPAALLIVLPNGLVKLINALPFICGDLRTEPLSRVWENFRQAWHDPRVARFIEELAEDPGRTRTLHEWVRV